MNHLRVISEDKTTFVTGDEEFNENKAYDSTLSCFNFKKVTPKAIPPIHVGSQTIKIKENKPKVKADPFTTSISTSNFLFGR